MLTFNDLEFKQHPYYPDAKQALIIFPNKYGVSAVLGGPTYCYSNGIDTYDVSVIYAPFGDYGTYFCQFNTGCLLNENEYGTADYQTADAITLIMKRTQEIKPQIHTSMKATYRATRETVCRRFRHEMENYPRKGYTEMQLLEYTVPAGAKLSGTTWDNLYGTYLRTVFNTRVMDIDINDLEPYESTLPALPNFIEDTTAEMIRIASGNIFN